MIRNEREYQEAMDRLDAEKERLKEQKSRLREQGLTPAQIKNALDPMTSFHAQLREEVESYERLKRGEFGEISNLQGLGSLLVGMRIAQGITQRQLAERLDVHESQVSRDERNEYHGITLERVSRVLEALGVELRTKVEVHPTPNRAA
ncbi:MAG: helix-turn-helix domain-containing protein [Phycisphaeraceae bacterium]|nr:helix-turn-helix domain-containing protein [Phycisphaeraceae bacterium]